MRIRRNTLTLLSYALSLATLMAFADAIAVAESPTLDEILGVWKKREDATRTLHFEMRLECLRTSEGPAPTKLPETGIVWIDGNQMRYERVHKMWVAAIGDRVPETMTAVFNGKQKKMLHKRDRSDNLVHSKGWLYDSAAHPDANNMHIFPVTRHFRPLSPSFGAIKKANLRLVASDAFVNEVPCVLVEEDLKAWHRKARYWIAPSQEMSILRYERTFQQKKEWLVEAVYESDESLGWIPSHWSAARFAAGDVLDVSSHSVVAKREINAKSSPGLFDVTFPPGTEVFNDVEKKVYIIKRDGQKRVVLPSEQERGAKYLELLDTDPGEAARQKEGRAIPFVPATVFATLVMLISVVLMTVRRQFWSIG